MCQGITDSVIDLIGNTPMMRLKKFAGEGSAAILAKLEMFNPAGSIKDRIAWSMIEDAEDKGILKPGATIVEATSGNTGIGLAMIAAAKDYNLILTMPETMSEERIGLLRSYGAQVELTPGDKGMKGAVDRLEELLSENPDYYSPKQFENPANPEIHRKTTAHEILKQTGGKVDAFVAGIGTGGTITGVGEVLKRELPGVEVIGVEPAASPVLSGGAPGPHKIQGIGAGFIPATLNVDILDRVIQVTDRDAYFTAQRLATEEGLFAGISSGAAAWAAEKVAGELGPGRQVVVILPDTGERYLSMRRQFV